jgi:hypothetical protein
MLSRRFIPPENSPPGRPPGRPGRSPRAPRRCALQVGTTEPLEAGEEVQVLPGGQIRVDRQILRHEPHGGLRRSARGFMRSPRTVTSPASGASSPAIIEIEVVLPAPLGPRRP